MSTGMGGTVQPDKTLGYNDIEDIRQITLYTAVIQAAAQVLVNAALNLLDKDGHTYSTRPCATCAAVSAIVGRAFGCSARAVKDR